MVVAEGRTPLGYYIDIADARFDGETNVTEFLPLPINIENGAVALIFVFEDDITAQDDEGQEEPQEP